MTTATAPRSGSEAPSTAPVRSEAPPVLVPVDRDVARAFVAAHHRHNEPPVSWKFGVGLAVAGELVGVAMVGRPVSKELDDGLTVEVTRVCTLGSPNASSRLYGAACRAAAALGYQRAISYTLVEEPGTSLRAAGFREDGRTVARDWQHTKGPRVLDRPRLFDVPKVPPGPKIRWLRDL